MWRATTKLRAVNPYRCGYCTDQRVATAAAKGTAPPLTSPPEPGSLPPPPPSGGGGGVFLKLLGLSLIGSGGVVGYSWYDAKFRKQIEDTIPGSKAVLGAALAYLPNRSDSPAVKPTQRAVSSSKNTDPADRPSFARTIKSPETSVDPYKEEEVMKDSPAKKETTEVKLKKEVHRKAEEDKRGSKKDMVQRIIQEREAEEAAENAALEKILSDTMGETVETARSGISALDTASTAIRQHMTLLKSAMDDDVEGATKTEQWKQVSQAHEEKSRAQHKVEGKMLDTKESLEKLQRVIKEGRTSKVTRKNKSLLGVEELYAQLAYDVKNAEANLERALSENSVMEEYRDLIKKGREEFRKELESVKPEVRIGRRVGGRMTEEELNLLIAHAHRRVEQLQRQLAEQASMEDKRVEKALRRQQLADLHLADGRVGREMTHLKAQFELEKRKVENQADATIEEAIRAQLTRQAAAHSDHLTQVLAVQQNTLENKYNQVLHDQVLIERDSIREEVAGWIARLQGIECAVEARAELELLGRKAQELWISCQALVTMIESNDYNKESLVNQVNAIRIAGNEHPFVQTVLKGLSQEAVQHGVMSKDSLTERFHKVQRVCRRVAMIDETNSSLFRYFLSYFQSLLIVNQRPIMEDNKIDVSKLTTFDLVNNARYCLEKGDLEQAVKYMNQLNGEPRRVATDWLKEALLLLETKQAADALFAHASCSGLGSLG